MLVVVHAGNATAGLDTRVIPHAIRHATILVALGAIAPGFRLDPVAGPDEWKLRFTRT